MKYKQIKMLILITPTITIALWEYVRHEFLLPYISMDLGNVLSPVLVFLVTLVFVRHLFSILEKMQEELRKEKTKKAALIEREKLARELHDGVAQSLFLLSVKLNKFERKNELEENVDFQRIKKTLQHVHADTRQAIDNLKYSQDKETHSWMEIINQFIADIEEQHGMKIHLNWGIQETTLTSKEKVELFACIKESVMNVIKHAKTNQIWIFSEEFDNGWICKIKDKGVGFNNDTKSIKSGYGLQILNNRTKEMGWKFSLNRKNDTTVVEIKKEVS